jgi:hypothetical protein
MKRSRSPVLPVTLALGAALYPGTHASPAIAASPDASLEATSGGRCVMPEPEPAGEVTMPPPVATLSEPVPERTLEDDPPSDERTPRPTATEWRVAASVQLSRLEPRCKAQRVREWLRITCPARRLAAMELLAGPREGVSFDYHVNGHEQSLELPLRRGDRRVLQIVEVASWSKYTVDYDTAFAISEEWLAGAEAPTVVVD